jgi:hypothetical protein
MVLPPICVPEKIRPSKEGKTFFECTGRKEEVKIGVAMI